MKAAFSDKRCRGLSLVIVLASLVLLVVLAVAFLASVSTELRSSKANAEETQTRLLAHSAVNLASAQITAGSRGVDSQGRPLLWVSQPGMMRSFDASGEPAGWHRLYSWDGLSGLGAVDPFAATNVVPADWHSRPATFTDLNEPVRSGGVPVFPIADPSALGVVEGFSVSGAPVATGPDANPLPMPVKWLYVLADGKVVAPQPGASESEVIVPGAGAGNPIAGRMAFWADDETCKVNVNTAAEGCYWDTPRTASLQDFRLALYQPAQREYQRYSGHPATVSLSTVFPSLSAEEIYQIAPRVTGGAGSSLGGTVNASSVLTRDSDRLYAGVGELAFRPGRVDGERVESSPAALNEASLERLGFFLTANSRAPDLNPFNLPRIGIWPVSSQNDAAHRSAFDQMAAFCTSVSGKAFHFQRADPRSATTDLPAAAADSGLGRNRLLLGYLRDLCGRNIPGYGGNFAAKYAAPTGGGGTDCDQILLQIFDYIRSQNVADVTVSAPFQVTGTYNTGAGQVVPIEDPGTGTRGFGRFPTVQGAFFLFAGVGDRSTSSTIPAGQTQVQAGFFVNLFNPAAGFPYNNPDVRLRVSGLENFQWQSWSASGTATMVGMGFPPAPGVGGNVIPTTWNMAGTKCLGGSIDVQKFTTGKVWSPNQYKLVSTRVNMPSQSAAAPLTEFFAFSGGAVRVEVLGPDDAVVQTVELNFPAASAGPPDTRFPVPRLAPSNFGGYNYRSFTGLNVRLTGNNYASFICPADVVRAVVPSSGDLRLVAPRKSVVSSPFHAPHAKYGDSQEMFAHNLRNEENQPYYGATPGRLLNLPYHDSLVTPYLNANPSVSTAGPRDSSVVPTAAVDVLGDWDNGFASFPDGPYINKADEGTDKISGADAPYYGYSSAGAAASLFSPNRMLPSAGMFGSLPSGVWAGSPWQTLVFCPHPLAGSSHPGLATPPDYLLLDFFHMPVVEPYAISEPLSTAGRINMNCQLLPFSYIRRETALHAALKAEKVIAIPDASAATYKRIFPTTATATSEEFRHDIDATETLETFRQRLALGEVFRSSSEICSIPLVPKGETHGGMATYWNNKRLTGDNSRERPYTTLYPRLTTRSNTFTIHYRVQALRQAAGSDAGVWTEGRDRVVAEQRGSETIEKFIDPAESGLPDYAANPDARPVSDFQRTRVLGARRFSP
jgi:uncharacterized protein (TIGR02600 family)